MNCRECLDGIPDAVGDGFGIATCKSYEAGVKSGASRSDVEKARVARGNRADEPLFWGGERDCKRFRAVK